MIQHAKEQPVFWKIFEIITLIMVFGALAVTLFGCQPVPNLSPATPTPAPMATPANQSSPLRTLPWELGHTERAEWSKVLRSEISSHLADLKKADWFYYCPKFSKLDDAGKTEAIAEFAVAVSKFESGYNPASIYHEPPPLGVDSIGLYQLSYEDGFSWCKMDKAKKTLQDPKENIVCAIGEFAKLIVKDNVVAEGYSSATAKGLARYWSVVRDDHAGTIHKKQSIAKLTKAYPSCD